MTELTGQRPITKRQMRIWNRRKLELRAAANEFRNEEELAFIADRILSLIHYTDLELSPTLSPFMSGINSPTDTKEIKNDV